MTPVLTPSEARVRDAVAHGLTNAGVAANLCVTVKCVEYHLTNIYRKTGLTRRDLVAPVRRSELAIRLDRLEQEMQDIKAELGLLAG